MNGIIGLSRKTKFMISLYVILIYDYLGMSMNEH